MRIVLTLLAPLPGIFLGGWVAQRNGVPSSAYLPNFLGALIGLALFFAVRGNHEWLRRHAVAVCLVVLSALALTFAFPGTEGVHRWWSVGSVHLNVSLALAPLLLFGIHELHERRVWLALALAAGALLIYVLQPDTGQAVAFGIAAAIMSILTGTLGTRWAGTGVGFLGIVIACFRNDPLPPVDHVERIFHLLVGEGLVGVGGLVVVIACLLLPLRSRSDALGDRVWSASGLAYWMACLVVTQLGNFPAPVIGAGASGVIGWYLLAALVRTP